MAVAPLTKLVSTTIEINEARYDHLVKESEQLRILKNFVALEEVLVKSQIEHLIKAMEVKDE